MAIKKLTVSILVLMAVCMQLIVAQTPVLDEDGNETGLVNLNPDPDGEPWIHGGVKPLTAEEIERVNNIPMLTFSDFMQPGTLPDEADNTKHDEFPDVFTQKNGSCSQAAAIGYVYSYQMNVLRGVPHSADNQMAYGFTYNYLNGGTSSGSGLTSGWDLLEKLGCPTVQEFHGSLSGGHYTRWMDGYFRWKNSNNNRAVSQRKIDVSTVEGLQKLKQWFYDRGTGGQKGGCVIFNSVAPGSSNCIILPSGPHAGEYVLKEWAGGSGHAMTFAGYSDNIGFDFDGQDGIKDVDLDGSGEIELDEIEEGCVLLVNSYGDGWCYHGTVWVPYRFLYDRIADNMVYCVNVSNFEPKLELKIKMTHSARSNIILTTGYSSDPAADEPDPGQVIEYNGAFRNSGGEYPMCGKYWSETMEFCLDISKYSTPGAESGKLFLTVEGDGGVLNELALVDYSLGTAVETPFPGQDIPFSGTTHFGIAYISPNPNLSKNKPVFVSSEYNDFNYPAENAVDGNYTTVWGSSTENKPQWICVDFSQEQTIRQIVVHWYRPYYGKKYAIYGSNDKNTWDHLGDCTFFGTTDTATHVISPASYRYFALWFTEKNKIAYGIRELEMYEFVGN